LSVSGHLPALGSTRGLRTAGSGLCRDLIRPPPRPATARPEWPAIRRSGAGAAARDTTPSPRGS